MIFVEQDADAAADEGSDVQLTPVTPAALPDEVGLRHKTTQEPQEELCRQRKRDEGLRRWLSQHTSGRAAPDASEPSKPRHAEAPRRPGKSCAEGRPRTQGAALAV